MSTGNAHFIADLSERLETIPEDSILSHTLYVDDTVRVTLFGFAPGQQLTEHTAAKPAVLHVLRGEGLFHLGEEEHEVGAGSWAQMPSNLPHSISAKSELHMLLYLLK